MGLCWYYNHVPSLIFALVACKIMQAGRVNVLFFKNWKDHFRLVQILLLISCPDINADLLHLIGIVLLVPRLNTYMFM